MLRAAKDPVLAKQAWDDGGDPHYHITSDLLRRGRIRFETPHESTVLTGENGCEWVAGDAVDTDDWA